METFCGACQRQSGTGTRPASVRENSFGTFGVSRLVLGSWRTESVHARAVSHGIAATTAPTVQVDYASGISAELKEMHSGKTALTVF